MTQDIDQMKKKKNPDFSLIFLDSLKIAAISLKEREAKEWKCKAKDRFEKCILKGTWVVVPGNKSEAHCVSEWNAIYILKKKAAMSLV